MPLKQRFQCIILFKLRFRSRNSHIFWCESSFEIFSIKRLIFEGFYFQKALETIFFKMNIFIEKCRDWRSARFYVKI